MTQPRTYTPTAVSDLRVGDWIVVGDATWPIAAIEELGVARRLVGPNGRVLREPGAADKLLASR